MAHYTLFTNPMSRGRIARWALHEVGATYNAIILEYGAPKPAAFLEANPLGKIPAIIHHADDGDHAVAETAAICAYLAETEPAAGLAPTPAERADYLRWMFFAAGPVEQAITAKTFGFEPDARQQMSCGFGTFDRTVSALTSHLKGRDFVCGKRFTMADVYVGSQVAFGLMFKTLPDDPVLTGYMARATDRPAYAEAAAADQKLIDAQQPKEQA